MNKKRMIAIIAIVAIVAIMTACLCACNAESITKKLEKKGYKVQVMDAAQIAISSESMKAQGSEGGIEWLVLGEKGTQMVYVTKYEKSADAKKAYDAAKSGDSAFVYAKKVGRVVFIGDEQAVKDAM